MQHLCSNAPISVCRRQHPPSAMAGGSSIDYSSSSSRQSLQFESFPREGLSLDPSFNHPSQLQGRREDSMETDNAGDEDKDENVEEANDNELRFGLTDDLLLKCTFLI